MHLLKNLATSRAFLFFSLCAYVSGAPQAEVQSQNANQPDAIAAYTFESVKIAFQPGLSIAVTFNGTAVLDSVENSPTAPEWKALRSKISPSTVSVDQLYTLIDGPSWTFAFNREGDSDFTFSRLLEVFDVLIRALGTRLLLNTGVQWQLVDEQNLPLGTGDLVKRV